MAFRTPDGPLGLSRAGTMIVRAGLVAWALVGIALVAYGLFRLAAFLRILLLIVGLAVLIVLILEPVVSRLERARVPRVLGTALTYLAVLVPLALGLWWLGGVLLAQLRSLVDQAPELVGQADILADNVWGQLEQRGVPLPAESPEAWIEENRDGIVRWAITLATSATRFTGLVLTTLIGPIVGFYILVELPRIRRSAANLIPAERRTDVLDGMRIVGATVGAFFRGQLLIAIVVGLASTLGLMLLRVPYAVLVGTIAGVTNLVPLFGPIVGSVPGIALGLAHGGIWLGFKVLILFVVVQQLESHVLSPLILGASVRVRPVAVVIGMLAGAVAAGLLGMILVIPIIASAKSLYERFGPPARRTAGEQGEPSGAIGAGTPAP